MNPRAGIALMRPLRLAVSSITGVYARFHDSRINSHAEPGSLARFLDTDDNLPIKTLEFRDSEKSASEPSAGVYSPNAVSAIISHVNLGVHPLTGGSGTKSHLSTRLIHQHTPCSSHATSHDAHRHLSHRQQHGGLNFSRFRPLPPRY